MAPKHCLCHSKLGDCQDISRHINERVVMSDMLIKKKTKVTTVKSNVAIMKILYFNRVVL